MFDDYVELQQLKETADILAKMDNWSDLYDEKQLTENEVPVYSITYVDDMYVSFDLARNTASKIRNCRHFVTNALYHNGYVNRKLCYSFVGVSSHLQAVILSYARNYSLIRARLIAD